MTLRSSKRALLAAVSLVAVTGLAAPAVSAAASKTTAKKSNAKTSKKAVANNSVAKKKPARVVASVAGVTLTTPPATLPIGASTTTTTAIPVPTTVPPTTTTVAAPVVAPFDVVAVAERVDVAVGSTAVFSIVVAQRGAANPIALSLIGLPNGMGATLSPNPATGLASLRITVPSDAIPTDYPLRVLGSFNGAQAWANLVLRVTPVLASTTTSTSTTTIDTSGLSPSFGFRVTPDGKSLFTGGQVQYEIEPIYDTGYNGSIEYFVSGLPDGVWHGFSEKVTTKKTTLWLSSTVPLRNGRYTFTITGVSKGLKKSGEVVLVIG